MSEVNDKTAEVPVSAPAGWYADPSGEHERRYWDGTQWTGGTEDADAVAVTSPATPRRIGPQGVLLSVATSTAAVLAALSFGENRERLALVAVALVLPLAVSNIVGLARSPERARRSAPIVATAWFVVIAVIAVGGYRGFQRASCTSRLGPNAELAECGLSGRDLTTFDLHGADLSNADLSDADLNHVDLTGARLDGATLENADLNHVNLTGASLDGARLRNADLTSATLDTASLREAVLDGASLESASLSRANLSNARLHDVAATEANLSGAVLHEAEIDNADLTAAQLDGADLSNAVLMETNLGSTTLSRANFEKATLTNVVLDGAILEGATGLSDAALAGAFGVDPLDVANALSERALFLESPGSIASAAAAVCTGTPMGSETATSPSNGAFVEIVNQGPTTFEWPTSATARRFLELVACVGPITSVDVDECGPYFFPDGSVAHPITRYRESVVVTLLNPATGAVVEQRTFDGSDPEPCPISVSASVYRLGGDIDEAQVDAGITEMVTATGA